MVRQPQALREVLAEQPAGASILVAHIEYASLSGWRIDLIFREILQQAGEVLLFDDAEAVGGDDLRGLFGIVRAEDEDALSIQQERVQIGDADPFAGEDRDSVGGLTGTVVEFDGEYFAERNGDAGFLEDVACLFGLGTDDAEDAEVGGVGNGGGDQLDVLLLEQPEHPDEGAGLVLDEDG